MEDRAVVLVDGRAEQLILDRPERPGEPPQAWVRGEAVEARVARVDRGLGLAYLDAGDAPGLISREPGLREGERLSGRVSAPARAGKLAVLVRSGAAAAAPSKRMRPDVAARAATAAAGAPVEHGPAAREACDASQDEALAGEHALPGGARISIEATRALVAVDVDLGASATGGDPKRRRRLANLAALQALPRLLRLKGLGGVVAIDLAGRGQDGPALSGAAEAAFRAVFADWSLGPISRFGVLQVQIPWLDTPVAGLLQDAAGAQTSLTRAFALLRAIEREAGSGERIAATCAPSVYAAAAPYLSSLAARIGERFVVMSDVTTPADAPILRRL